MNYHNKTCKDLISLCKEKGIKGYSGKNKNKLIELIQQTMKSKKGVKIDVSTIVEMTNSSTNSNIQDPYCHKTIKELIEICKEKGIKGYYRKNKQTLIKMLQQIETLVPNTNNDINEKNSKKTNDITIQEYNYMIEEIKTVATNIHIKKTDCDGRMDSALKEKPFLEELKIKLLEKYPNWEIIISPPRASCDIMINHIKINLKLTDCKSSDNSVNKPFIFYSITGLTTYPYSSNWNEFLYRLTQAKINHQIKKERNKLTEYHYLVKNKLNGNVLLKPIFDIHTYVDNASNDLQINWKHEFIHLEYYTEDSEYLQKVESLLTCIQKSVREMIKRTQYFADADIHALLTQE